MRYRTYTDWINTIYQAERDLVDSKRPPHFTVDPQLLKNGSSSTKSTNNECTTSGMNDHAVKGSVVRGVWDNIDKNFFVSLDADGVVHIQPQESRHANSYCPATLLVVGRVVDGKNYTGYSLQMRPGNYYGHWSSLSPLGFTRKIKVGANGFTVYDLDGNVSRKKLYHVPQAEATCDINGREFIWFDEQGKLTADDWFTGGHVQLLNYNHRTGEYRFKTRYATTDRFYGRSRTSDEFYKSIARYTKDKYTDGTVDRHAMMLLVAKCHKLANEFAGNAPDGKVTLLPMLPEKYVHTDCRSFHGRTGFLGYQDSSRYGTGSLHLMPACARRVHYMNKTPTAGLGVLMPTIIVTYTHQPTDGETFHSKPHGFTWMNSVCITVPPILTGEAMSNIDTNDLEQFSCSTRVRLDQRGWHESWDLDKVDRRYEYNCLIPPGGIVNKLPGEQSAFVDSPEYIEYLSNWDHSSYATPRSTFTALRKPIEPSMQDSFHALMMGKSSQTDNYLMMYQLKDACFDFRYSKNNVAVSYCKTKAGANPVHNRFPLAKKPEEIFVDVEAQALLDSLPVL